MSPAHPKETSWGPLWQLRLLGAGERGPWSQCGRKHLVAHVSCHPPECGHGHGIEALAENSALYPNWAAIPSQDEGTLLLRRCHPSMAQQELATWWPECG